MLGGMQSPTVSWVLTIPLLSFFYLGSSPDIRMLILLMFFTNFAAFWTVSGTGAVQPNHIDPLAAQALGVVSTVASAMYVAMMALFYAKALASQGELEVEMRDHAATALDLRRAAAAADRAGAAKSEFLARLSSELRIPLHTVIGYSSILADDAETRSPQSLPELRRIRDSGLELLRFANDILDLSKIETGRMEIFNDVFSPADLIREVVAEMGPAARANNNQLRVDVSEDIGSISSDMRKIRIILFQLVSNAAKFTANGDIEIQGRLEDGQDGRILLVQVSDSGIGIPQHKMAHLFEQFVLNDDASASRFGGSGLGLALSRNLCRLLGGDIAVDTEPGRGTRFTFWIPAGSPIPELVSDPGSGAVAADGMWIEHRLQHEREILKNVA